ncbi:hypothetical protein ACQ4M4_13050 [Leptolyngbya sp. AN02str]|uniref:hypothetical protein n=1 Tax=Leptolyngbya sp. AN02str TaxID=3423363 RepID=UPI003D31C310
MDGLAKLTLELRAIAPILGVADLGGGNYRIDFHADATPQQQFEAESFAASWEPSPETVEKNWDGIENDLRGSAVFSRIYSAAYISPGVGVNLYVILNGLRAQNLEDLVFGFSQARLAMSETAVGDFDSDQLQWLRDRLAANGFDVNLFGLGD